MNKQIYIVKIDFNGTNYYAAERNDGGVDETYNPRTAKTFKSKKAALDWFKNSCTMGEHGKAVFLEGECLKFDTWVNGGMIRRSFPILSELDRPFDEKKDGFDDVCQFIIQSYKDEDSVRYENYQTWPDCLLDYYPCLYTINAYEDDVNVFFCGQLMVSHDSKFSGFKNSVNAVKKYLTLNSENYYKYDIFDYKCGEGGDFVYLMVSKDGKKIFITQRLDDDLSFKDLKEAFEYIKKYRYYE